MDNEQQIDNAKYKIKYNKSKINVLALQQLLFNIAAYFLRNSVISGINLFVPGIKILALFNEIYLFFISLYDYKIINSDKKIRGIRYSSYIKNGVNELKEEILNEEDIIKDLKALSYISVPTYSTDEPKLTYLNNSHVHDNVNGFRKSFKLR